MKRLLTTFLGITIVALTLTAAYNIEQLRDDFINTNRGYIFKVLNEQRTSGGTGFVVTAPSGTRYLMTNAHVCGVAVDGKLVVTDDFMFVNTTIAGISDEHDLCLIHIPQDNMTGIPVAESVREGQNIFIVGYPLLEPVTLTKGQLSGNVNITLPWEQGGETCKCVGCHKEDLGIAGIIFFGQAEVCLRDLPANPVTADIHPGNSGSPVMDSLGNLVGVAFAGGPRSYIIPLKFVQQFLQGR